MTTVYSIVPLLACLASLVAVVPIVLFGEKRRNAREASTFVAGGLKLLLVLSMLPGVLGGKVYEFTFVQLLPGVALEFRVDGLGMLFALVASGLWIVTSCYSIGYMRSAKEHSQTRFYSFFAVSLCATLGVAFAGNLLTLYLFYEMLSLATYPLVTHHQDKEARGGGRTYLTYLLVTSIAFALPAVIFSYIRADGAMDFTSGGFLDGKVNGCEALVLLLLFTFGFAKAGVMPFHSWLPNAMVAPTPVSALLHAVAVVKVGVFCIIRAFTGVLGTDFLGTLDVAWVITWIAGFTVLVSSLIALTQDNLKRRLAFSTIGQLSYIVLGVSFLNASGVTGAAMHIGTHAVGKITLFFCAGAIYIASGKKYVSQLAGIGRKMPYTMGAFLLASISIIGLPPFFGAWSKWYLFVGGMEAHEYGMVAILAVSSLLNIAYLLPIGIMAFFPPSDAKLEDDTPGLKEAPMACVVPLCITAGLCFVFFIFPNLFKDLAQLIAVKP